MGPRLPKLEQNSLSQRAYEELKAAILGGDLPAGSQLAELELAAALGISRTPVREAIARLRNDGLVEAVQGGGNVVRTMSPEEVRELFVIRQALEELAVREWATASTGTAEVEELEALLEEQERAQRKANVDAFLDADERFHITIARQAGLVQTADLLLTLRERMRQAGLGAVAQPDRMSGVLDEHAAVVKALRSRDPDRAGRAILRHLTATRSAFETAREAQPQRSASKSSSR